jgi:hypothetical protein
MTSIIKVDNLQNQCGANIISESSNVITIGASGDTVTLAAGASQSGFGRSGSVNWDTTPKTANFTGVSGEGYFVDTTSGAITIDLPATPAAGDIVAIADYANTAATNNITVGRNSSPIDGEAIDATIKINGQVYTLVYVDATEGWKTVGQTFNQINTAEFVAATGGTITTCGDFKVHTFTGPGTFTVTNAGNSAGSNSVDYLVVAGGGGGGRASNSGAGGGGAGGLRASATTYSIGCGPASPLVSGVSALPVSAQGYPITIGAGGAGGPGPSSSPGLAIDGNPSVFSSITSAGGGRGGGSSPVSPSSIGSSGGSGGGGGAGGNATFCGGSGNTPPTSPPQGNNGGTGFNGPAPFFPAQSQGGGGGGAIAAGTNRIQATPSLSAAPGGAGAGFPSAFGTSGEPSGSFYYFAGGGGGASRADYIYPAVPNNGGLGGGGNGGSAVGNGILASPTMDATANTGGGGGGSATSTDNPGTPPGYAFPFPGSTLSAAGGGGGSGIVIIRYKYQ